MNPFAINLKKQHIINMIIIGSVLLMIVFQFVPIHYSANELISTMIKSALMRFLGGIVFITIVFSLRYTVLNPLHKPYATSLLLAVPGLLVSIYNFPFIAYFNNTASVTMNTNAVLWFAVLCLSVGVFEEVLFRGIILIWIVKKMSRTRKGILQAILLSSLVFSLFHLINVFSIISPFDLLLQIGYTFLMGAMWAVIVLKTRSLWITVVLHAIYNFCGLLFFTVGTITGNADIITIITTTVLAVGVAYITIRVFFSIDEDIADII